MKKIIVIGASGTLGKGIVEQLGLRHEVITVGRNSGQYQVKIEDPASVRALFEKVGKVDGVVVAAGDLHFGPLAEMTAQQFQLGLNSKLMGQVNVALAAQQYLNDGGSITLTSGSISENPIRFGANASTVNRAVEGFVLGAAIELPRGLRINVISPTLVDESVETYGPYFYGMETVPVKRAALAYSRSVEGAENGKTYRVW
ncbi:NAD(P)-dependent dehydrogenase, short-chain alcohol dehydrogenase family [Duganella sp. CF458]|uniref:short chain dehydrogenase n=1 Tax=Duganella sp. CF458 TaxID=1884368 RepID=UPI0008E58AB8|nr:short chain dehydrogenase [Duganella sp. CF458]SFG60942.1 NAD(P)-dependent dehydrogenase, short-chain alcohol dehydrogenase family [Duganella sp. CF458]